MKKFSKKRVFHFISKHRQTHASAISPAFRRSYNTRKKPFIQESANFRFRLVFAFFRNFIDFFSCFFASIRSRFSNFVRSYRLAFVFPLVFSIHPAIIEVSKWLLVWFLCGLAFLYYIRQNAGKTEDDKYD